jgi:hypothetical protein
VVGGLIPGIGLAADIRDLGAAVGHIAEGKEGAWLEMGAAVIGFVPCGDIAKGIAKGVTKATTKAATKVGVELVDDAAKVLKSSTATATDGLTSAQKTSGIVNAPEGRKQRMEGRLWGAVRYVFGRRSSRSRRCFFVGQSRTSTSRWTYALSQI